MEITKQDYDAALDDLVSGYQKYGCKQNSADSHIIEFREAKYRLEKEDVEERAEFLRNPIASIAPNECSILSVNFREQAVVMNTPLSFPLREDQTILGTSGADQYHIEYGLASTAFRQTMRFEQGYAALWLRRLQVNAERRTKEANPLAKVRLRREVRDLRDLLPNIRTVKVRNLRASSLDQARIRSDILLGNALFILAQKSGTSVSPRDEWNPKRDNLSSFKFVRDDLTAPLPKCKYNQDLVVHYQRGVAADDPLQAFMEFYKVLEYFFVKVTDEELYGRLSSRINNPRFMTTPENLDRIIHDVSQHQATTDETEMLKAVLASYLLEEEVVEFVKKFEAHLEEKHFTQLSGIGQRLGLTTTEALKFDKGHFLPALSRRLKSLRNSLVHSSDRHERKERLVPSNRNALAFIHREVPLLRFLAEKVIIANADAAPELT